MGDPFQKPSAGRGRLVAVGLALALVAGGAVAFFATRGGGPVEVPPGPVAGTLTGLDFAAPSNPVSGYRALRSVVPPGVIVYAVDVARDGTVAFVHRGEGRDDTLVVVRDGELRTYPLGINSATSMAFDPEGDLHIGTRAGTLRRLGRDGVLVDDPVEVSAGNSIVAFAFDPESPKSAVMTAGGSVWTAMRPFAAETLTLVEMPRARIRTMAFEEGVLVLGGDSGAVFSSSDEGWEDRTLPTSGRVVAMGHDAQGALLVAQANGHVFRADGVRWDRLGQVPKTPFAVGQLTGDRGVTVLAADSSLFALLGREDFSELPEYTSPQGATLTDGVLRGANVAYIEDGQLRIWDGATTFDSRAEAVTSPPGTMPTPRCRLVGPDFRTVSGWPEPLFECGDALYRLGAEGLEPAETVSFGGVDAPAEQVAAALRRFGPFAQELVHGQLWATAPRHQVPGLVRYDPAEDEWVPVAPTDVEGGPLLAFSARGSGDAVELWAVSESGQVLHGAATDGTGRVELAAVATHEAFQEHYGEEWYPRRVTIHGLADGLALVVHDESRLTRVRATGEVEPVEMPPVRRGYGVSTISEVGDSVWIARGDSATFRVTAEGPPGPSGWPGEVSNLLQSAHVDGDTTWLVLGSRLVRCDPACAVVEVRGLNGLQSLVPAGEGRFAALSNGVVGVFPVPGAGG